MRHFRSLTLAALLLGLSVAWGQQQNPPAVYVIPGSPVYHVSGCPSGGAVYPITLDQASELGRRRCEKCNPPPLPNPSQARTLTPPVVFITKTGKDYHSDGCKHLSQTKRPVSLQTAIKAGYKPDVIDCNPPTKP